MNNKEIFSSFLLTNIFVDGIVFSSVLSNIKSIDDALKIGAACFFVTSSMSIVSYLNKDDNNKKLIKNN